VPTTLAAVRRSGQEPAICRPPPLPPYLIIPWPPKWILCSVRCVYTTILGVRFTIAGFMRLKTDLGHAQYEGTLDYGTQRITILLTVDETTWIADIDSTYRPPPPNFCGTQTLNLTIANKNPFMMDIHQTFTYPYNIDLTLYLTV
jgi:hypothetical protein